MSSDDLQLIIMRVQASLIGHGYDTGAIDGALNHQTVQSLKRFQSDHGLSSTGTMTTETLNALGVKL